MYNQEAPRPRERRGCFKMTYLPSIYSPPTICQVGVVPLTGRRGVVGYALVDPSNWVWALGFSWHLSKEGYARTTIKGKGKSMHRLIMGDLPLTPDTLIDHHNRRKLDNRRANLHTCNHRENANNVDYAARKKKYGARRRSTVVRLASR
jgi:hypothetical protein